MSNLLKLTNLDWPIQLRDINYCLWFIIPLDIFLLIFTYVFSMPEYRREYSKHVEVA